MVIHSVYVTERKGKWGLSELQLQLYKTSVSIRGIDRFSQKDRLSVKARTKPNQTEPTEITEPAQPNLRKLTDSYAYRYRVLAPIQIRTLVLLTPSSLIIIIIINY